MCTTPNPAPNNAPSAPSTPTPLPTRQRVLAWPLIALVKLYQFTLSPIMGRQCRFYPTCSWYALEALRTQYADDSDIAPMPQEWREKVRSGQPVP
jgi:hypothetical protein